MKLQLYCKILTELWAACVLHRTFLVLDGWIIQLNNNTLLSHEGTFSEWSWNQKTQVNWSFQFSMNAAISLESCWHSCIAVSDVDLRYYDRKTPHLSLVQCFWLRQQTVQLMETIILRIEVQENTDKQNQNVFFILLRATVSVVGAISYIFMGI